MIARSLRLPKAPRLAVVPLAVARLAVAPLAVALFAVVVPGPPVTSAFAGITSELVLDSLTLPIFAGAPPGDARLFLAGQRGSVHIIENDTLRADPFLDIDSLVHFTGVFSDRGFYGFAFHPDYASNGWFFVYYMDNEESTHVARYTVSGDPNKIDHASGEIVLSLAQPHPAHNGGQIVFGPDGMLYVPLGDGGLTGDPDDRAQDPLQLFGKIVRIEVDSLPYSIPHDNPFVANPGVLDEIWAFGMRNPYRPNFDALTGDFWIADVGQDSWEEINVEWAGDAGGHNYGWSVAEGYDCYDPPDTCGIDTLDAPLYAYDHTNGACSITGGFVYRGAAIPNLYGCYLFGDFCSRRVFALRAEPDTVLEVVDLTPQLDPTGVLQTVTSIVYDGFGEPWIIDRTGGVATGRLYRVGGDAVNVPQAGTVPQEGAGTNAHSIAGAPYPNPFREAVHLSLSPGGAHAGDLAVYDVRGRRVRFLSVDSDATLLEWDGRDDGGTLLPAGIYFLRLETGRGFETRRVTILR